MKKSMSKMVALVLALMLALSTGALAAERASDAYRVPGVRPRPESEATAKPSEGEVATPEEDSWTLGGLPIEPQPSPEPEVEGSEEAGAPEETEAPVDPEATEAPEDAEATEEPEASAEPEVTPEPEAPKKQVELHDGYLNVRSGPSTEAEIIDKLEQGDEVEVLGSEGGWTKVRLANGTVGYVKSEYLGSVKKVEEKDDAEPEETEEPAGEQTAEPTEVFEYERNADGSLKLDESGSPIPVIPEGATQKPVAYKLDDDGNLVLDENGNPIPTQYLPVDAQKVHTIQDALDDSRSIDIYADWGGGDLYFGMESKLIAVLKGYDKVEYTLQWQTSPDNSSWTDIDGATGSVCKVVVTEENYLDYWRVLVNITGVLEA